jgi:hypothetical protein
MEMNLGKHGATQQGWARDNIRQICREIQNEHPKAQQKELAELLSERLAGDYDARKAAATYIIANVLLAQEGYEKRNPSPDEPTLKPAPRSVITPEQAAKRKQDVEAMAETIRHQIAKISLLNLEMPNGKRMRYCTGAEMIRFGGKYMSIGKKVGKTKTVGQCMDETTLHKILD